MSCFTLRTKSPPESTSSSSSVGEALARRPGVGEVDEAGVGQPRGGEPGLLLVGGQAPRRALRAPGSAPAPSTTGTAAPAAGPGRGARR